MKLGKSCKLYYSAALLDGSSVTPALATWVEITLVKDLTLDHAREDHEATTRGSGDYIETAKGMVEAGVEFGMKHLPGNAGFDALRDAWIAGTTVAMAIMDGDIATSGSEGLCANMVVDMKRAEPVRGEMDYAVTIKPGEDSYSAWYEPTGS